ncbi:MAG: hypothetical protein SD837_00330 [Candidatus Electrothrix scaldis]|nr:MAG: hypothetical protein SD837_00330 [Candidatus Electrothrix sp. GW3-3]
MNASKKTATANISKEGKKNSGIKKSYEKPKVIPIALFADQVLSPCDKLGAPISDGCDAPGNSVSTS